MTLGANPGRIAGRVIEGLETKLFYLKVDNMLKVFLKSVFALLKIGGACCCFATLLKYYDRMVWIKAKDGMYWPY